jgi:hypothetical protein
VYYMGLLNSGDPSEQAVFSCSRLSDIELDVYATRKEGLNIDGYQVWFREDYSWPDPWGRLYKGEPMMIGGFTNCTTKTIVIGLGVSVYPHEVMHAIQGCFTPEPIDEGLDEMHSNWNRDGFYADIDAIAARHP